MKVHPDSAMDENNHKKLRKLPHVFNKVLELPLASDADVSVEEGPNFFRFTAEIEICQNKITTNNVSVHPVEIHPGVIKIVVRHHDKSNDTNVEFSPDKFPVDTWRFRLPSSSRPELAHAVFENSKIIVTVPNGIGTERWESGRETWSAGSQIFLVQQISSVVTEFVSQLHRSHLSF